MDSLTSRRKPGSELVFLLDDNGAILMVAELRCLKACYDLLAQEKAEQDEALWVVHTDKEDLAAELQAFERRRRS